MVVHLPQNFRIAAFPTAGMYYATLQKMRNTGKGRSVRDASVFGPN